MSQVLKSVDNLILTIKEVVQVKPSLRQTKYHGRVPVRSHTRQIRPSDKWVKDYVLHSKAPQGIMVGQIDIGKGVKADITYGTDSFFRRVGFKEPSYDWRNEVALLGTPEERYIIGRTYEDNGKVSPTKHYSPNTVGLKAALRDLYAKHLKLVTDYHSHSLYGPPALRQNFFGEID